MKRRFLSMLLAACMLVTLLPAEALALTPPTTTQEVSGSLQNGSFETPRVTRYNDRWDGIAQFSNDTAGLVWKTTGTGPKDRDIEIARPELFDLETASLYNYWQDQAVPDGKQFAEINCEAEGALYQDVETVPGDSLSVGLAHRGRHTAENWMKVIIMPTDAAKNMTTEDAQKLETNTDTGIWVQELSGTSSGWKWHQYDDVYTVPDGQTSTRFFFVSTNGIHNSGLSNSEGNFIDAVQFTAKEIVKPPEIYSYTIQYQDEAGAQLADSTAGEATADTVIDQNDAAAAETIKTLTGDGYTLTNSEATMTVAAAGDNTLTFVFHKEVTSADIPIGYYKGSVAAENQLAPQNAALEDVTFGTAYDAALTEEIKENGVLVEEDNYYYDKTKAEVFVNNKPLQTGATVQAGDAVQIVYPPKSASFRAYTYGIGSAAIELSQYTIDSAANQMFHGDTVKYKNNGALTELSAAAIQAMIDAELAGYAGRKLTGVQILQTKAGFKNGQWMQTGWDNLYDGAAAPTEEAFGALNLKAKGGCEARVHLTFADPVTVSVKYYQKSASAEYTEVADAGYQIADYVYAEDKIAVAYTNAGTATINMAVPASLEGKGYKAAGIKVGTPGGADADVTNGKYTVPAAGATLCVLLDPDEGQTKSYTVAYYVDGALQEKLGYAVSVQALQPLKVSAVTDKTPAQSEGNIGCRLDTIKFSNGAQPDVTTEKGEHKFEEQTLSNGGSVSVYYLSRHSVEASFAGLTEGGQSAVALPDAVDHGGDSAVTFAMKPGYRVKSVTANGTSVTGGASATDAEGNLTYTVYLKGIGVNQTVVATLEKDPAQWYTVTYHANNGTTEPPKVTGQLLKGEAHGVEANAFVTEGYAFTKWTLDAAGTKAAGDTVTGPKDSGAANLDLYANWTAAVTFKAENGKFTEGATSQAQTYTAPAADKLTLPAGTADTGYRGGSWYKNDAKTALTAEEIAALAVQDGDSYTLKFDPYHPAMTVEKTQQIVPKGEHKTLRIGDTVSYTVTITNTGDQPLTNVTLTDTMFEKAENLKMNSKAAEASGDTLKVGEIAAGEKAVATYSYTVAEEDEGKSIQNAAVADTEETGPITAKTETDPVERRTEVKLYHAFETLDQSGAATTFLYAETPITVARKYPGDTVTRAEFETAIGTITLPEGVTETGGKFNRRGEAAADEIAASYVISDAADKNDFAIKYPLLRHTVTYRPGDHGTLALGEGAKGELAQGSAVFTVPHGAAPQTWFTGGNGTLEVLKTAEAKYVFNGWQPALDLSAAVTVDIESTAQWRTATATDLNYTVKVYENGKEIDSRSDFALTYVPGDGAARATLTLDADALLREEQTLGKASQGVRFGRYTVGGTAGDITEKTHTFTVVNGTVISVYYVPYDLAVWHQLSDRTPQFDEAQSVAVLGAETSVKANTGFFGLSRIRYQNTAVSIDGTPDTAHSYTETVQVPQNKGSYAVTFHYYRRSSGGDPGGGQTIEDDDIPLAPGLNKDDHFAYVIGYPDGTVRPSANIDRQEVATIFFRLMQDDSRLENWSQSNSFTDVQRSQWSNNAVSTMAAAGILNGYQNGTFRPSAPITRAEFAAIASRFDSALYMGEDQFTDISGHWAAQYINRAAQKGWIKGYEDGTFRPNQYITRAEAMTLVNAVLDRRVHAENMLTGMTNWPDNPKDAWFYEAVQEATNSHDYDRENPTQYETWTELTPARDWTQLEREWSVAAAAYGG